MKKCRGALFAPWDLERRVVIQEEVHEAAAGGAPDVGDRRFLHGLWSEPRGPLAVVRGEHEA